MGLEENQVGNLPTGAQNRVCMGRPAIQNGKTKTADFVGYSTATDWLEGHEWRAYGARSVPFPTQPFRAGLTFSGRPSGPR